MTDKIDISPEAVDRICDSITFEAVNGEIDRVIAGRINLTLRALYARLAELEAELHLLKTSGIVEVAVRNPSVMEYMQHWEGRAEAAEAKLEQALEDL